MTMRAASLAALLAATTLGACGLGGKAVAPVAGMLTGARPASAVSMPKDGPEITVTLTFRGIRFPMRQLETEGDVTTWIAADGATMETRNGMVIATRGFGQDLMSASVPTPAQLVGGAGHQRVHFFLDGTDTTNRRDYTCTVAAATGGDGPAVAHHLTEACVAERRRVTNEYWIDSRLRVIKSKQWISNHAGYVVFSAP